MRKIVSVHAHYDSPGKSQLTVNLAASVALMGKRVGVLAADPAAPGLHALFGLDAGLIVNTVSDYLAGRCELQDAAYRVTPREVAGSGGSVYLVPGGPPKERLDAEKLSAGFEQALAALHLDFLFVDAPAGSGEAALLSVAACDWLVLVLRPDRQDYFGTAVAAELARSLGVSNFVLVLHEAPASLDPGALRADVERVFAAEVGAILPAVEGAPAGAGLLALKQPDHPFSKAVAGLAAKLVRAG